MVIDPYETLGVGRDADDERIRAAYRRASKTTHPDTGGSAEDFLLSQQALELLLDPVRRKFFDETGYDLQLADPADLQGLLVIEKLVNDIVLDDREPGTFDPIAGMREKLADDIGKARFQIREMQGHQARIRNHLERLGKHPGRDVLGYMLRNRMEAIAGLIAEAAARIEATEHAHAMLGAYSYAVNPQEDTLPEDTVPPGAPNAAG